MSATSPILPAAGAAAAPVQIAAVARGAGASPRPIGAAPPGGAGKDAGRKDFPAALGAAEKNGAVKPTVHPSPVPADGGMLGMLGMQWPVHGSSQPPLPPLPAAAPGLPKAGIPVPAATVGSAAAPPDIGRAPNDAPAALNVAAAASNDAAALCVRAATPGGDATPPGPASVAMPAIAAANPTAAALANTASVVADGGTKQKSMPPGGGSAPESPALAAAAAPLGPAPAQLVPGAKPAPRPATVAPNSAATTDKPVHATNGPASTAISIDGTAAAAASLAVSAAAPNAGHAGAAAATFHLDAGIHTAEFSQALLNRVAWMVDHGLNGANLQVTPPHLGPIQLRISVDRGHAVVWMSAQNATTLDALQSNSPKLREMLGAQGFSQVSVDISQRSFQDRPTRSQSAAWSGTLGGDGESASVSASSARAQLPAHGVLDAYA